MANYVGDGSLSFSDGLLKIMTEEFLGANSLHFNLHKLRDKKTNFMHFNILFSVKGTSQNKF